MKVTLEYDLEKQDDRQEYMVITKAVFLEEVINDITKIVFSHTLEKDDIKLEKIREVIRKLGDNKNE